jgi:hypothetical protein
MVTKLSALIPNKKKSSNAGYSRSPKKYPLKFKILEFIQNLGSDRRTIFSIIRYK